MTGLPALVRTEARLMLREPAVAAFVILLPAGLLLALGLALDLGDPASTTGRESAAFVPALAVALVLGMVGFFNLPNTLSFYRDTGVLRRLSTTPASPAALLVAQMVVNLIAVLLGIGLLVILALTVLGLPAPAAPESALLVTVLGGLALFAVGLVIAAVSPSAQVAAVLGPVLFFPFLFLAGAWVPLENLSPWLAAVGRHSPLGALVDGLLRAWAGVPVPGSQLLALTGTAFLLGLAAVRAFRWE